MKRIELESDYFGVSNYNLGKKKKAVFLTVGNNGS